MLGHEERLASARAAVDYITGRTADEQRQPVPNCPGWTVYHAASHIGRVGMAWAEMIRSTPDDPESRARGYARSEAQPASAPMTDLAAWVNTALDLLDGDTERPCYFSMTGGAGTTGLWAWHAASELGVHRLDVEDALGHPHQLTDQQAIDAITYTAHFFLPAMRRATGTDPGVLDIDLSASAGTPSTVTVGAEAEDQTRAPTTAQTADGVTIQGPPTQVLLAMWGRANAGVEVVDGDAAVWDGWRQLPGRAFQFGAWD